MWSVSIGGCGLYQLMGVVCITGGRGLYQLVGVIVIFRSLVDRIFSSCNKCTADGVFRKNMII